MRLTHRRLVDADFKGPAGLMKSRTSDQVGAQPAWRLRAIQGPLQVTLGTTITGRGFQGAERPHEIKDQRPSGSAACVALEGN